MLLLISATLSTSNCVAPTKLPPGPATVKHPDAPMLIAEAQGRARVAIWDASCKCLTEYGWVNLADLTGLTIGKYDWEAKKTGKRVKVSQASERR
jgi:hypothetical protein